MLQPYYSNILLFLLLSFWMKLFTTILSVYILVLIALPCIDAPNDISVHKLELNHSAADPHQNETAHCSPFCTCDCCCSPVLHTNTIIQISASTLAEHKYPGYISLFISTLFVSIWQPPKISWYNTFMLLTYRIPGPGIPVMHVLTFLWLLFYDRTHHSFFNKE